MKVENLFSPYESITLDSYLRAYGIDNVDKYLDPPKEVLESCWLYDNMRECANTIKYHILEKSNFYIVCDADTDGICSSFMIYRYLKLHDKNLKVRLGLQDGKERGIETERIRNDIKEYEANIVIIPDGGTNSALYEDDLMDLGMDICILDHHDPTDEVCKRAIVVNNMMSPKVTNKSLSGTGVTFKVCQAVDQLCNTKYSNKFIDLVGISIVSDSMDIRTYENRWFLNYILEDKENIRNPFFYELFDTCLKDDYTQRDISFKIVPKLNSVIRCGTKEDLRAIYYAMMGKDIDKAIEVGTKCHNEQVKRVEDIIKHHKDQIDAQENDNIIVISSREVPKAFNGLCAGKISDMTNKPCIMGKEIGDEILGSYRGYIPSSQLAELPQVTMVKGHSHACGIGLRTSDLASFKDEINNMEVDTTKEVTYSFGANNVPKGVFETFDGYDWIWGKELEAPSFYVHGLIIKKKDIEVLKGNTIKIKTSDYNIVMFGGGKFLEQIKDYDDDDSLMINFIGNPSINVWKGRKTNQFQVNSIEDIEVEKYTETFEDLM